MDRLACVDLPAFPLQLLLRRFPEWRGRPVAVVDRDHPQGRLLWVDETARQQKVLPGQRYSAALSHCRELRAAEVSEETIAEAAGATLRFLWRFSPSIEPVVSLVGSSGDGRVRNAGFLNDRAPSSLSCFWVDASGLESLYPSLEHWTALVCSGLASRELSATVVVGFSKFGTCAVARSSSRSLVFDSPVVERDATRQVPLDRLPMSPRVLGRLVKLGVRTIGDFVELPAESIGKRFSREVVSWHASARAALRSVAVDESGAVELPLIAVEPESPIAVRIQLGYPERSFSRLLRAFERQLPGLLERLAQRSLALRELEWTLFFESGEQLDDHLKTAAPTLEIAQVRELLRLRFESLSGRVAQHLAANRSKSRRGTTPRAESVAVVEFSLEVRGQKARQEQLEFFSQRPARDRAAAQRALARLRAEFGEGVVVRARLEDGHLPEARFLWEPLESLEPGDEDRASSSPGGPRETVPVLVRRIYERSQALPPRPRHEPDGWMLRGLAEGPVAKVFGPFVLSGGWWRQRIHREYHFAETQRGDLLWVYYDRFRRRWFLQGRVE